MQITTIDDVSLEYQWHEATSDNQKNGGARAVVVATHPHPLHGGDMHNTAPATLAQALPAMGVSVLRFNFRGVGASTGEHDNGMSERLDLQAAIGASARKQPDVPVVVAGYSFGADVGLDFAADAPNTVIDAVAGVLAIAPPLRMFKTFSAAALAVPKHIVSPAHDQFCPPATAGPIVAGWTNTTLSTLDGTDHFLLGSTDRIVTVAEAFVSSLLEETIQP